MEVRCFKFGVVVVTGCWLVAAAAAADTNLSSRAAAETPATDAKWSEHVAQAYQESQAQQQATLRALEQVRQEAAAATATAKRNADENEARLRRIEDALGTQRERELAALQSAQRFTLITVGILAGGGFFGMLIFAFFLVRSLNRRADLLGAPLMGGGHPLGPAYAAALGTGDTQLVTLNPAEQANARFLNALDRLEQRIREMENPAAAASPLTEPDSAAAAEMPADAVAEPPAKDDKQARIALLLGKGQALFNLQQADTALACFDQVIALDPTMAEAFVKKGTALERLGRIDEAIDNYDRAIALDDSMTMAYLCKGGVFNRLERYGEALQCYEQALRTQEKVRVG